jgi:HEPN domain-containing protein
MAKETLTYLDFAADEALYLITAYSKGLRYNAMVAQAQRICECYMKHVITRSLMNNNPVMTSHNLRTLYEFLEDMGLDMKPIRAQVMMLNNFYTHTRYPGKDAFMASEEDIVGAVKAIQDIIKFMARYY